MTATSKMSRAAHGFDSGADNPWRLRAACRGMDPDAFVLGRGQLSGANVTAIRTCARCPVRTQCRTEWRAQPTHRRAGFIAGGIAWRAGEPAHLADGGEVES